jgi:transposase
LTEQLIILARGHGMNFIGIDLYTNRFTCCYRDERPSDRPQDRATRSFELNEAGLAAFYGTLTADTYVLVEATITSFSFVRLFKDKVKEVMIGNTYQLKQISLARNNTDKIDADKPCQALKAQVHPANHKGKMAACRRFLERQKRV